MRDYERTNMTPGEMIKGDTEREGDWTNPLRDHSVSPVRER